MMLAVFDSPVVHGTTRIAGTLWKVHEIYDANWLSGAKFPILIGSDIYLLIVI